MRVDFFFDPTCPWCWITSRWIAEVQPHRDLDVHWRSFSLFEKNRDKGAPEYVERARPGHHALRVAEAIRKDHGATAVGKFYTELGSLIHYDHVPAAGIDLAKVLASAALPVGLAAASEDSNWDTTIKESMDEALSLAGQNVGVPLISFDGEAAFFGPVVSPAPTGDAALQMWDAVATLAKFPGFYELKSDQRSKPEVGQRPVGAASASS